jgi:hypothetical protein
MKFWNKAGSESKDCEKSEERLEIIISETKPEIRNINNLVNFQSVHKRDRNERLSEPTLRHKRKISKEKRNGFTRGKSWDIHMNNLRIDPPTESERRNKGMDHSMKFGKVKTSK